MQTNKPNLIVELSFQFSLKIISYCKLLETKKKYNLANQLFRSGTSIGANVREAQNAESKNDFVHKMKIAAKEADETEYCLLICKESKSYPDSDELINEITTINKVISKIISTTKQKK
ncbi:MAG: four helix bundle protein [Chitinophagales bacterium]|nr:four helix bundle protein [Chitinophagales bacterium]